MIKMNDNERVVKKESVVQIIHLTSYNFYNYLSVYLLNASNGDRRMPSRPEIDQQPSSILLKYSIRSCYHFLE